MEKVNGLSRKLDWKVEVENDNKNQKLIKEEWVWYLMEIVVDRLEVKIIEKIK